MELNRNEKIDGVLTGSPSGARIKGSDERGQAVLDQLRETIEKEGSDSDFGLNEEYWVKYYLEAHVKAYDIEINENLDHTVKGRRGDYSVRYRGEKMILEVEKDLKNFFQHGHETSNSTGWNNPESIDLVFAATDTDNRREELDIPIIVANDFDDSEFDQPTFDEWYNKVREIKSTKEAFVLSLLSAVYWYYTKGTPTVWEVLSVEGEIDSATEDYLMGIHNHLWTAAASGVNEVLFNREPAVQNGEEFADLKEKAKTQARNLFEEKSDQDCPECSQPLTQVGTHQHIYEPDLDNMSEGELAEHYAAQQGGAFEEGIHGETLTVTYCFDCLISASHGFHDNQPIFFDNKEAIEL